MRRSLRFALGWLAAALAAVGVSWAVIRDAVDPGWLSGTAGGGSGAAAAPAVVGQPTARTAGSAASAGLPAGAGTGPGGTTASRPGPSGSVTAPATSATAGGGTSAPAAPHPATSSRPPGPAAPSGGATTSQPSSAGIRSYAVTGGRVLLRLTDTRAELVSATPDDGYRVQSWENTGWLRVDFSQDGTTRSSVFATWNGTPPTVTTARY